MASGCAILTTKMGEIPSMIDDQCAILLEGKPDNIELSEILMNLTSKSQKITEMKEAGIKRFRNMFSKESYKLKWQQIFNSENLGNK